ncbi:MAG: sensor histidine kinase [Anaerolineae bacterium]
MAQDLPSPSPHPSDEARVRRLEEILRAAALLNSTLNLPMLLQRLMDTATRLTQTEASSILMVDRKTGELRFEAATGIKSDELQAIRVPLKGSVAGWVFQHGQPLAISNTSRDGRFYRGVDEQTHFRTRSILAVPLVSRGVAIGVLEVLNKVGDAPFTDEDVETMAWLAGQAAIAIENARAFRQADLVSDVVHELRTPLTSIIGYSKMLLITENLDPALQRQFLETIHREATRMGNLVNEILELSRLESGRIRLAREPVALNAVVEEAAALLGQQARDKGLDLRLHLPDPSPVVLGDAQRLRQVFLNLLSNAVKYNRPGGWVAILVERRPEGSVAVAVQDSGKGIAREHLPRLFEKFFRVDEEEVPKGSGLGLAIARQIVEAHEGRIEVESELGRGSTFTVVLPAAPAQQGSCAINESGNE